MTTNARTRRSWISCAPALLSLVLATAARADEPPEDAASILRRARVAETVERDVPKALDLYKKALDAGGTTDVARDAALRLADLQEVRGQRAEALDTLRLVTDRLVSRLDDEQKRRVHEAMARLLPAGSRARSPLGEVYVLPAPGSAAGTPGASPLESKILAILARLDDVSGPDVRAGVEASIRSALDLVGRDALPTLERVMTTARLDKAQFAATEAVRLGGVHALPMLERAIGEGDAFARGAAVAALGSFPAAPETSPAVVATIDRVLDVPAARDKRALLTWALVKHLSTDDLLKRTDVGGPDADVYLLAAVRRQSVAAIEKAVAKAGASRSFSPELLASLATFAGVSHMDWQSGRVVLTIAMPTLDPKRRYDVLRLVLAQERPSFRDAVAPIAGALVSAGGDDLAARAATDAWTRAMAIPDVDERAAAARSLAEYGVRPPRTIVTGAADSPYWHAFDRMVALGGGVVGSLLPAGLSDEGAWKQLIAHVTTLPTDPRYALLYATFNDPTLVFPASLDGAWNDVLALGEPMGRQLPPALVERAATSGDARFVDAVRAQVLARGRGAGVTSYMSQLVNAVASYHGPGRLALVLDLTSAGYSAEKALVDDATTAEFWPAFRAAAPTWPEGTFMRAFSTLANATATARVDWIDLFALAMERAPERMTQGGLATGPSSWTAVATAAARTGDARFVSLLSSAVLGRDAESWNSAKYALVFALEAYHGEGRLDLVLRLLSSDAVAADPTGAARRAVLDVLQAEYADPSAHVRLVAIAGDPVSPASAYAIGRLVELRERDVLLRLMKVQLDAKTPGSEEHRTALIVAAAALHLREAIPFLLREFQEGLSSAAAKAMDDIREYHDRLERYSAWSSGEDGGRKSLTTLLKDADPEIRRAAVLSIGAMGERDALPALLQIAKSDGDARVRQAALDVIERMSKTPPPAPATPPAPAPGAPAGGDGR